MALPQDALGLGDLFLLYNHESQFSTLTVVLNPGYTYSFTVDKLSKIVLVSIAEKYLKSLKSNKRNVIAV